MTDCERTALYFDGELAPDDEAAALAHLAGCASCQAEVGDRIGLEVALSRRARRTAAPAPRRRSWAVGAAAAAAAVAVVMLLFRDAPTPPAIALAEARTVEVRLTSPAFDRHRPYRVARAGEARELLPLEVLVDLERRGDRAGLAAAHVIGGDLARASAALAAAPPSPARDSDRAAIAVAAGDPMSALRWSGAALAAAPALAPAHWNRALALQALDLSLAAAAELEAVAARGEPGWSDDARTRAGALDAAMTARARDLAQYQAAVAAMIGGSGPPVTPEQARRHPGPARRDLLDAIALAGSAGEVRALAPLAAELDRLARTEHATRAVTAAAARDFAVRRRFQARYRALIDGALDAAALSALIAELARAGDAAIDILEAVILDSAPAAGDLARLRPRRTEDDPWFAIRRARRGGELRIAAGDSFGAEVALLAAMPACRDPAWSFACGYVERDLGDLYLRMRRLDEADLHLRAARTAFATAGAPGHEDFTLQYRVNLERLRDRDALALAYLDEIRLRAAGRCEILRFVDESQAAIAYDSGDVATLRQRLVAGPGKCGGALGIAWLMAAVDLGRLGAPADRDRATALLDTASTAQGALGVTARLGRGRLSIDADPERGAALLREGLAALGALGDAPGTAGELRVWAHGALIGEAGRRSDWAGALAVFAQELGAPVPAGCLVAVSTDHERATAVVRGSDGALRGSYQTGRSLTALGSDTLIPPALSAALTGCPAVAVIARPPLHGRDDLLPVAVPWSFVGQPRAVASAPPPARPVIISDPRPPTALGLPSLPAVAVTGATQLIGTAATPAHVLAELRDATYVEIHAHGLVDLDASDTAFVALSPDADGRFALTAAEVRAVRLEGAPIVVLAACHAATSNARLTARRWGLPDAFLVAGARTVIAASTAIPDDQGTALFGELRARLERGEPPVQAVAALRASRAAAGQRWAAGLMVFE